MRNINLGPDELHAFRFYFAGLASMSIHPGAGRSNGIATAEKLSLYDCADQALAMIEIEREVINDNNCYLKKAPPNCS